MQWLVLESQIFLMLHSSKLVTRDVSFVQLSQDICPIQDILLHNSVMCLANFPSQSGFLEIPRGRGVSKAIFKWKYEPKLKLTVGLGDYGGKRGGVKLINLPWEGTDIFLWNNIMEKMCMWDLLFMWIRPMKHTKLLPKQYFFLQSATIGLLPNTKLYFVEKWSQKWSLT